MVDLCRPIGLSYVVPVLLFCDSLCRFYGLSCGGVIVRGFFFRSYDDPSLWDLAFFLWPHHSASVVRPRGIWGAFSSPHCESAVFAFVSDFLPFGFHSASWAHHVRHLCPAKSHPGRVLTHDPSAIRQTDAPLSRLTTSVRHLPHQDTKPWSPLELTVRPHSDVKSAQMWHFFMLAILSLQSALAGPSRSDRDGPRSASRRGQ